MPTSTSVSTLESKTQQYWLMSSAWNGRALPTGIRVTTGDALAKLSHVLYNINPARPLSAKVADLLDEVIKGNPSRTRNTRKGA